MSLEPTPDHTAAGSSKFKVQRKEWSRVFASECCVVSRALCLRSHFRFVRRASWILFLVTLQTGVHSEQSRADRIQTDRLFSSASRTGVREAALMRLTELRRTAQEESKRMNKKYTIARGGRGRAGQQAHEHSTAVANADRAALSSITSAESFRFVVLFVCLFVCSPC